MASPILYLLEDVSNVTYFIAAIVIASLLATKIWRSELDEIPTVGPKSRLTSWWTGFSFSERGLDVVREGYAKYKHRPFKIADKFLWIVVVTNREHVKELANAGQDTLSLKEAARVRFSGNYTIGKKLFDDDYHVPIILSQFSRNIGTMFPDIREEVITAFDETLNLKGDEWKSVPMLSIIQKVAFRTSNRFFVGLPLCRDPDWMNLNMQNLLDIVNGTKFLQRFPRSLEPLLSIFMPTASQAAERGMKFLAPIIAERQTYLDEYGDKWADKPNDFLSWLMDEAKGEERTAKCLTARVLTIIFASVHSSANSSTHALFFLAANPQYIRPLREEVEDVIRQEGWSKAALTKMHKIDSFLKESQRVKGGVDGVQRKAMKDFTFSDGTFIPKGTTLCVPTKFFHLSDELYENAGMLDPFRFSEMREPEGERTKHQLVSINSEYLSFGLGKQACPGRFFAANVMKLILVHVLLSYDVKLEDGAPLPECVRVVHSIKVEPSAKIVFRRRS